MALVKIHLIRDSVTGKQDIIVKLESDADALPHEHEHLHRTIVEKLVGNGLPIEDLGNIIIHREGVSPTAGTDTKKADQASETPISNSNA